MSLADDLTQASVEERLAVWEALSEFFLDTEPDRGDDRRIARVSVLVKELRRGSDASSLLA